jgi:hypothetical protein
MTIRNLCFGPSSVQDWSQLYLAALFETDKQKLPSLIAEAEKSNDAARPRTVHDIVPEQRRR